MTRTALLAATVVAATIAAAPTPPPTFPPLPFESARPTAAPGTANGYLPEIGRVRAASPACAAIRDVVVPSFSAALKADQLYLKQIAPRLDKYAEINADPNAGVTKTAALFNLDRDVSSLFDNARKISDALGDPRVAAEVKDPQVQEVRTALQGLYAAQMARAGALSQFVQRETARDSVDSLRSTTGNPFATRDQGNPTPPPIPTPDVAITPVPGMPILHGATAGIALADRNNMQQWTDEVAKVTRSRENTAAKTFYTVAKRCR